ncbi:carotenoid oxygenase family protein [Variovorax sp. 770b2]|uniref:carotenoid oxygenase family protein n=1 Tax=Variovorax sp. 770b2 TaxID=1566271 RepID=UPI0008EF832A|nr:carotenoid oxygenase family protein [Variovorax sp. 770b2]SFQ33064.1 Carotenoid cleavage dioxygenase [Variovorax sp. 770b2]
MNWQDGEIKRAFHARRHKPWTVGYEASVSTDIYSGRLETTGRLPKDLQGILYRNGPAMHERGAGRYAHKWDGDGMVHAFRFADDAVTHTGRYVRTKKYLAEESAGEFLFSTFGSSVFGKTGLNLDIDDMNAANLSAVYHAGRLLALWEPGSPYELDPETLETKGILCANRPELLRPFSAHPKIDTKGELWNFGSDPITSELSIYKLTAAGVLEVCHRFTVKDLPPMHDFAVTENHLIFLLPPTLFDERKLTSGKPFGLSMNWAPALGTRVLVIDKRTWAQTWYLLPAWVIHHVGNAWEDADEVIRFDLMANTEPRATATGWSVMRGKYVHVPGPVMTLIELRVGKPPEVIRFETLEGEFPVVDPAVVGREYDQVLCLARSPGRPSGTPGWGDLAAFDVGRGTIQSFGFGNDWIAEEHVYAGRNSPWAVGTALDLAAKRSVISVFNVHHISDGPVAQVHLPYALPLGLHGTFRSL